MYPRLFFGKLLGGPGKTSLRAGFGMYYTSIEALTIGVLAANAPYGTTYSSPAPPLFANPFITASTGQNLGQYFPVHFRAVELLRAAIPTPTSTGRSTCPSAAFPAYPVTNRIPYTEEYMFSHRAPTRRSNTVSAPATWALSHIAFSLLVEANPGDPALCLSLSQPVNLAPGQHHLADPFWQSNVYTTASGQTINGTRGPLGPHFGSDTNQATIGNSNYNALELSLRHTGRRLEILGSYTYSKSLDQSSNLGEEINPINPALSRALSAFDVKHNFVVSYNYQLPLDRSFQLVSNRWTKGWTVSGITRFSTGFPVTLLQLRRQFLAGNRAERRQQLRRR